MPYSDDFYRRLQEAPPELARLAYYRDICVGVLGCRVEAAAEAGAGAAAAGAAAAPPRVYMTVLAVLAPYRDMGIGSALLRGLLEAMEGGRIAGAEGARELYLHVWEENKEAVRGQSAGGARAQAACVHACCPYTHAHTHSRAHYPLIALDADCLLPAGWLCRRRGQGGELLQAHHQPARDCAAQALYSARAHARARTSGALGSQWQQLAVLH